jgi:signal transduction histidine kinase/ActR/RegA family two-component response regulator
MTTSHVKTSPFENLARLAQAVTASLQLQEVLGRVARAATDLLPDSAARIWVVEGDRLVLRSEAGTRSSPGSGRKTAFALGEGLTGQAALARETLVVKDVVADPRTVNVEWMRQEGYVSLVSIPLLVRDRLVGMLTLLTRQRHRFRKGELEILTSFGSQAAIAIENARLFGDSTARQARLEALLEVNRELSRIQPVDSLLERIAETCGHLLDSDMVGIRVVEGDELVVRATWGDAKELVPTTRLKIGESLTGIAAVIGEPLLVTDPANDPRLIPAHREAYRRLGVRAFLAAPVKVGDRVEGVLTVRTRRPEGYSDEDLAVATAFASQAATALENARLYQQAQQAYEELKQTQDQLMQAQKMEAVGRLAGGIAHDFNNLLMVVMGRSQLMMRRLQAENPLRRDLGLIDTAMQRAADLTRQLLAFGRKQVLQPKVLDLNSVVANIDPMLRRLIGEDIELLTVSDPTLGPVKADPAQLEQVLLNLAINARDAMPQGGRLTIETANVHLDAAYARRRPGISPGPHVMLAVSDTGCGMDAETQARLFEPFFTTKGPGKGTGLGLSTVYGIVKQSGGNIWVYSEPGRGTAFKIYLPRVEEPVELEEVQPAPEAARPSKASKTILLVEDEDGVRELVRDVLQEHRYTVLEAREAGEAIQLSSRHPGPIHLLLTDVVMPQISGRALAERLAPLRPEMKVLYMSGYTENAIVHHGVLDQGTAFLQKPFTAETLAQKVREVLETARARERITGL